MKKKIFSILFALVLVFSFSLVTAVPAMAATLNVPSQYGTIQAAVNAANPAGGDTIIVAAGEYDESVTIDKSLTLLGAQAGVEPIDGGRAGGESNIAGQVTIQSGNVVVNGFEISAGDRGIAVRTVADQERTNISILYNYIHNEGRYNVLAEVQDNATLKNLVISHNYISGAQIIGSGGEGISPGTGFTLGATYIYDGLEISYNTITDIERNAIFAGGDPELFRIDDAIIAYNDISDCGWFGINVGNMHNADINNNTFEGCAAGGAYVNVLGGAVTDNEFINTGPAPWGDAYETYGLSLCGTEEYFPAASHDVSVTGNSFFFNEETDYPQYGARVRSGADASTIEFHFNNFLSGGALPGPLALWNKVDGVVLDAECNWWGHATGPYHTTNVDGLGGAVSSNVDFDPWLTAPCPPLPMSKFVIDHAKLDFKKKPADDKVRVRGKLELNLCCGDGVNILEDVAVTVGPLTQTITMVKKGKKGEKWEYKRPKGDTGDIKHMTINWKNGKFDIRMDKADLSGLIDPNAVTISIQIGDDFGKATITMKEKKHWDYKAPHD